MKIPFSELSKNARVWIYPSSRKFYEDEIDVLTKKIETFLDSWLENEYNVGFSIEYNRFLIVGVDGIQLATRDIDKLVSFIFQIQAHFEIELLDRMNVCFKQGEFVQYKDLKEFQKLIKQKAVSKKTVVFDNLIENKEELEEFWEIPITESWYNRFLK